MFGTIQNYTFPSQKKPFSKKDVKWRKNCVIGGAELANFNDESLRKSFRNKIVNYNLYSDILDQEDIERVCNPLDLKGKLTIPAKLQNYPISNPKIDLLVGELSKRKFNWKIRVMNDEAISQKEDALKAEFGKLMASHIQNSNVSEEEMQKDLAKFAKFSKYEFQDAKELTATSILKYLYNHLKLDLMFSKGFKDALLVAEEIYQCDIIAGEPIVRRLNPKHVHTVRSGESNLIEDSDIILIRGYLSPGQIIDEYYDELTPTEIDAIESRFNSGAGTLSKGINIGRKPSLMLRTDSSIDLAVLENDLNHASAFDENGNIKVEKVYWKSLRKMKKVKYYDEFGDAQEDIFDEKYVIDKEAGEEEEIIWINEWWEGHRIAGEGIGIEDDRAIYCRMRPRPVQFRNMENLSKCHPGIIGTIYNTNDNKGVSLMDRMKPLQYLYNVLAYNTELFVAKNKGKIMKLDLSKVPDGWQIDKWLSFATGMNIAVEDSFKEGNKGAAQGKLSGQLNASSPVIDMEMGNTIQMYISMMSFIKEELGEIAGVSKARQGQISNREAVGNVQREVTQSSHITEYWFLEHEHTRLRVLNCLLQTAKMAWKNVKNKKVQFVLDDGQTVILNIDGEDFNEAEYGLILSNSGELTELIENMKQLAHAGIQNGLITFSQLLDIYNTDSIAAVRRKIENAEAEKLEQQQQQQQQAQEMQQQQLEAAAMEAEKTRDFKREEWDRDDQRTILDLEAKIKIEEMRLSNPENKNIKLEELKLMADKIKNDYDIKLRESKEKERHNKAVEVLDKAHINKKVYK
jgi:hypothetical protein